MELVISLLIILFCTIRVVTYGIYTVKNENKTGGIGLFALALVVASSSVIFFMK